MKTRFNESKVASETKTGWTRFFSKPSAADQPLAVKTRDELSLRIKGKILVVDDDLVTLKAITFKLESHGYLVSVAVDYAQAASLLHQEKHDVMLLDIHFPPDVPHGGGVPWDGFRIIQWLRNFKDIGQIPIILMSGHAVARAADRARACGALDLLAKPIDSNKLLGLLELCMLQKAPKDSGLFDI